MSNKKTKKSFTGVRAKLLEYKTKNNGDQIKTLPETGIEVSIPKFINHGRWMMAQRQGKNELAVAQAIFALSVVKFEGETLTMADVHEGLIHSKDMMFLVGEVFGSDDSDKNKNNNDSDGDDGDEGNDETITN